MEQIMEGINKITACANIVADGQIHFKCATNNEFIYEKKINMKMILDILRNNNAVKMLSF